MVYLTGAAQRLVTIYSNRFLGSLLSPRQSTRPVPGIPWAADNDCFSQGDKFSPKTYADWLRKCQIYGGKCLFAVLPDVVYRNGNAMVGDPRATLDRSLAALDTLQYLPFRWAFVLQDGAGCDDVPWNRIGAVFIGGSTRFKMGAEARELINIAKGKGLWTHMGRVNSWKRFHLAYSWGLDSVDGTYLRFGPDCNWPRLKRWLALNGQGTLDF